jgi:hypothetical protein
MAHLHLTSKVVPSYPVRPCLSGVCFYRKKLIERAYREGERLGLAVWCADEAGPYQAIPHPGSSWQPVGQPARYPHEYVRGGTAKRLTLFHPATGQVRVKGVVRRQPD